MTIKRIGILLLCGICFSGCADYKLRRGLKQQLSQGGRYKVKIQSIDYRNKTAWVKVIDKEQFVDLSGLKTHRQYRYNGREWEEYPEESTYDSSKYDQVKAKQTATLAHREIRRGNPDGLLKLWEIATSGDSAEDSEIAAEEVRGYLYSEPKLWVKAFSKLDFTKFKKDFETTDFDTYRFTRDGEQPVKVVAEHVTFKLSKLKATNPQERVLIDYLKQYYGQYLK